MSESEIPSGWVASQSDELCYYITSGSRDWKKYYSAEGAIFIRTQDINQDRLDLSNAARVLLPKKVEGKRSLVTSGDLLITITGANVGKVAVVPDTIPEAYVSQSVGLMKLRDKSLAPFLHYYLQAEHVGRSHVMHMVYGMGRPVLSLQNLRDIPILLSPLAEQKRIVAKIEELFSELDAGEESLRRARRQLGVYRQSLLKQAFEGKLTAPWRAQHPDASIPHETTLAELVEIKSGNGFPKQYQGDEDGDFPFFKVGDISRNAQAGRRKLGRADNYISAEVVKKIRGTLIPPNATVFAKIGAAVALNRRAITSQQSLIDNNAMALIPCEKVDPDFLYLFMRQVDLGDKTRGGAVPSLRKGDIEEIPILLPSLPEQQEIVRLLDGQFDVIEQNEREIDAALKRSEALRQSILKKAFTGQLLPQDPTDEPASALLERIRNGRKQTISIPKKKTAGTKS
jgi:restriction endonuclease S subunit